MDDCRYVAILRIMSEVALSSDKNYNVIANSNNDSSGGNRDKTQTMGSRRGMAIVKGTKLEVKRKMVWPLP